MVEILEVNFVNVHMLAVIKEGHMSVKDHKSVIFLVSFFPVNFLHHRIKFPSTCHLLWFKCPSFMCREAGDGCTTVGID